jgi:methionine synthase I (cobalamin-dependent)
VLEAYAHAKSGLPIWVKPNAGLPRMVDQHTVYDVTPDDLAVFTARAVEKGANVVGGCCGTTPGHLAAIAGAVRSARTPL